MCVLKMGCIGYSPKVGEERSNPCISLNNE